MVDLDKSASQTTMSLLALPSSTRALPKASRVAAPIFSSYFMPVAMLLILISLRQFRQCFLELFGCGGDAVELRIVLHEADAFAFDRVGDEPGGLAFGGGRFVVGGVDGGHVVAIELNDVPAEGAPLV